MSSKRTIVLSIVAVIVALSALFFLPVGFLLASETWSRIAHRSQHRRTYETVVRPTAEWVRAFRAREGRLPNDIEVKSYTRAHFPDFSIGVFPPRSTPPARAGADFEIYVHIDDWNLYYDSWDGREWKAWTD